MIHVADEIEKRERISSLVGWSWELDQSGVGDGDKARQWGGM
jgi:hypothetical protein